MKRACKLLTGMLLGFAWVPGLSAQEVITPLYNNPRAAAAQTYTVQLKKATGETMLDLPVFDDFSNSTVTPDTGIWSDAFVFVNNNFCLNPVTNGVATLDALNEEGSIYSHAVFSPSTFVADHLTSLPVALDYPVSDSIYLSFLYQPGGLCDLPEEKDSLMVDFFNAVSGQWINVWRVPGEAMHPFQHAMIPITDERFLTNGFRFRFRNRASLSASNHFPDMRSNADYWHVDYIRLDRHRFAADTVLRDVAFNSPLNSVLKDLTAIPWAHFAQAYNTALDPYVFARYMNNDSITRNVTRSLTILEPLYNETYSPETPTAQDLPSMHDTVVNFSYIYPLDFNRGDSALIRFKAALRTDEFDPKVNDTVVHDQLFTDYYAYDDGTAEAGYGLRGSGSAGGLVAVSYNAYESDMLGGVYIYFNQVYDSLNLGYYFNLVVWDESDGRPGSIIWEDNRDYKPRYTSTYTGFVKYEFSQPVPVDGPFFVGWRQYNEYLLNVGLDRNKDPVPPVMYYSIQGEWIASEAPGVIMLRPFLYHEPSGLDQAGTPPAALHVYPNPVTDRLFFDLPEDAYSAGRQVAFYDASGRLLYQALTDENSLDLSGYPGGIYYLRIDTGPASYHAKIVINP